MSTEKSAEWIKRTLAANPCRDLGDGNYLTCPVRLSFPWLFGKSKPIPPATEGKYGANLLFPKGADLTLLEKVAGETALAKWPDSKTRPKLRAPWKDPAEMSKYEGYEECGTFISATADKTRPSVVDGRMQPVVDEERVYPGVWAVCVIRPFAYDKQVNKGVSFGLQSVMIIADDKNLGGGGVNPVTAFGGVQIDTEVNPAGMFGGAPAEDKEAAAMKALFG